MYHARVEIVHRHTAGRDLDFSRMGELEHWPPFLPCYVYVGRKRVAGPVDLCDGLLALRLLHTRQPSLRHELKRESDGTTLAKYF